MWGLPIFLKNCTVCLPSVFCDYNHLRARLVPRRNIGQAADMSGRMEGNEEADRMARRMGWIGVRIPQPEVATSAGINQAFP